MSEQERIDEYVREQEITSGFALGELIRIRYERMEELKKAAEVENGPVR